MKRKIFLWIIVLASSLVVIAKEPVVAYDIEMARKICDQLPLEGVEGIWLYPDDKVKVMILRDKDDYSGNVYPTYSISVVETDDARLHPGEKIGQLTLTPESSVYRIELTTERKNDLLLKPKSCLATLSKDGESFIIKQQKAPFRGRLNFNFNRLLPGFWKIVSVGVSQNYNSQNLSPAIGMIKVYPSYDGNGSSRRKVRYL